MGHIFQTFKTYRNISENKDVVHLLYRHCTDIKHTKVLNHNTNQ